MAPMQDRIPSLIRYLKAQGHERVHPPILQPADVFLDLTGEDIRRRMYLSADQDGQDLCLRPDFTIPVCRLHLETGAAEREASYCYAGPVFRQRSGQTGEFQQAGIESLGREDCEVADAQTLALALGALEELSSDPVAIRIGDEALFIAVLDGLGLPQVWKRRLRDQFGERERLDQTIARMGGGEEATRPDALQAAKQGFIGALEGADPDAAQSIVEDLLSIAGISAVGGRTAGEIAERFLEQAALASRQGVGDHAAAHLARFLDIAGAPDKALNQLESFMQETGVDLSEPISNFEARLNALKDLGIDVSSLTFSADFGRRLDYYTGFVFEIHAQNALDQGPLVGGGRYDKLLELLGAPQTVPAIGFSIWLDRISGGRNA